LRIVLEFQSSEESLALPLHYNELVQGMIYRNLEEALAGWLHDGGIPLGKRHFKLFTFSRLLGRYRIAGDLITFTGPVRLHVGSVHERMLQSLAEHLLRRPEVRLGEGICEVVRIEVEPSPEVVFPVKVRTLSPITVYSTLSMADGRKKTYYYSPFEREFGEQLLANLERKALALAQEGGDLEGAFIRPFRVDKRNLKIMKYRDTVIKAWTGVYELNLPDPLFSLAYDAGLGAKNSQGFGMVEVV